LNNEFGEPIQVKRGDDGTSHTAFLIKNRQSEWNELAAGQYADRELADGELTRLHGFHELGSAGDGDALAPCGAKGPASHVHSDKGEKRRIALLGREKIFAAGLGVPGLDRRKFRKRDQNLVNSFNDLLLLRGGELGKTECLLLHLALPQAVKVKLIVGLNCDCRQKRNRHQYEQTQQ
jgi:hypothetical protein